MKRIRIWLKATGAQIRELHGVGRNDYGDILLTLDGGDVVQFTPMGIHPENVPTPAADDIRQVLQGACPIILLNRGAINGEFRIIAPPPAVQRTGKPRRKVKDPRPYPAQKIKADTYGVRILELIPKIDSDRSIAETVKAWAEEKGAKDAAFNEYRVYGKSMLAKYSAELRKIWAKEQAKRRRG